MNDAKLLSPIHCSICGERFEMYPSYLAIEYPFLVCQQCDSVAVIETGEKPEHGNKYLDQDSVIEKDGKKMIRMDPDVGDNPVYIDGEKCWRLYKFGGWITQRDPFDYDTADEFFSRISEERVADDH